MKLTCTNFKYYRDTTITIPDDKYIHVMGDNGVGKSTVLKAVTYAIYGKQAKPYSYGTTTCKVVLETTIDAIPLTITRRSHPNTLEVMYGDQFYESTAAQEKLYYLYGLNLNQFKSAVSIRGRDDSIIEMSAGKRQKFIETLCDAENRQLWQNRLTGMIRETTSNVQSEHREYETRQASLKILKDALGEKMSMPSKSRKQYRDAIKKYKTVIRNHKTLIVDETTRLDRLIANERRMATMQEHIDRVGHLTEQYNAVSKDIQRLKLSSDDRHDIEHAYQLYQRTKDFHRVEMDQPEPPRLHSLLDATQVDQINAQINSYTTQLDRMTYLRDKLDADKKAYATWMRAQQIDIPIERYMDESQMIRANGQTAYQTLMDEKIKVQASLLTLQTNGPMMACPVCQSWLHRVDDRLVETEHDIHDTERLDMNVTALTKQLTDIKRRLKPLQIYHPDNDNLWDVAGTYASCFLETKRELREIKEDPERLSKEDLLLNRTQLIEKLDADTSNRRDNALRQESWKRKTQQNKKLLDELSRLGVREEPYTESEIERIQNDYWTMSERQQTYKKVKIQLSEIDARIKSCEVNIDRNVYQPVASIRTEIDTTRAKLDALRNVMDTATKKLGVARNGVESWDRYDAYMDRKTHYMTLKTQQEETKHRYDSLKIELASLIGVQDTCKEASILTNTRIVDMINLHTAKHLDEFFPDESIVVQLKPYRKNKTKDEYKPALDIYIEFNGRIISDINEDLSDGQIQLCTLAMRLAIGDIIPRPFLFMDECLEKLSSTNLTQTLMYLAKLAHTQQLQILVISHYAVDGIFDRTMKLT